MKEKEGLLILNKKISIFRRIYNKLFSKKIVESEINRVAEQLLLAEQQEQKEDLVKEFVPDKRTVVYDFFKENIPKVPIKGETLRYDYRPTHNFNETVEFENVLGNKRKFSLTTDEEGNERIEIGEKKIRIYGPDGEYDLIQQRHLWGEIISLVRWNNFSNQYNEDNTFVNELGRIITEISESYDLDSFYGNNKAEKKLYKELGKNPIYLSVRESFEKAYSEYIKNNVRFWNSEEDRMDSFRTKMKVEDIPKVEKSETSSTTEIKNIEIAD